MVLIQRLAILFSVFCLKHALGLKVSCKDERGNNVDWWYMYKLPKYFNEQHVNADNSGLRYFYVTSGDYNGWKMSETKVSVSDSLTAQTLNPIFSDQRVLLAAYNDEFPNGTVSNNGAHAKGVVATDGDTGIWLVHSVPKFPTIPHYEYPATGEHYAQSMLCLTLSADSIDKVGEVLVYDEPHFYYERLPLHLSLRGDGARFPSLERALRRQWRTAPPYYIAIDLTTLDGKKFKVFGKSARAGQELYNDFVAPNLDVNLFVETWRNGPGNLPSSCSLHDKVYNVNEIKSEGLNVYFKTTHDHSKWAVSEATGFKIYRWRIGGGDWTCVGDINRQEHQLARGGGTVCQKSSTIADLYRKLVADYDKCKKV